MNKFTSILKNPVILFALFIVVGILFTVIILLYINRGYEPNNKTAVDAYGDIIETEKIGQPNIEDSSGNFSLKISDDLYGNIGGQQANLLKFSIKSFIRNSINENEIKAVLQNESYTQNGEDFIYKASVLTNNAKTTFDITINLTKYYVIQSITATYNNQQYQLSLGD